MQRIQDVCFSILIILLIDHITALTCILISIVVQEKIDVLNERLERECGSGERSLPPGDFQDCTDSKTVKQKGILFEIKIFMKL